MILFVETSDPDCCDGGRVLGYIDCESDMEVSVARTSCRGCEFYSGKDGKFNVYCLDCSRFYTDKYKTKDEK